MEDLTLLYYTSNKISDFFANNVRNHLLKLNAGRYPIISVSQKPIDFGENICVGDIGHSSTNVYKQILIGAKASKTKYLMCCEDDSLYNEEHISYRPPNDDFFCYNMYKWNVNTTFFFYRRNRPGMCMCMVSRDSMIRVLEDRFEQYPNSIEGVGMGEPGRYERMPGISLSMPYLFKWASKLPTLTFHHRDSLGRRRGLLATDVVKKELPPWGRASDLWMEIHR